MVGGCGTNISELFLPEELLAYASKRGDGYVWRWKDLLYVADRAVKMEIASGGCQVLFRTPDGDCELCWHSFYPEGIRDDESWSQYVGRSWDETRLMWRKLLSDKELIAQGKKAFRLFHETEPPGLLPRDALWFVLYFERTANGSNDRE